MLAVALTQRGHHVATANDGRAALVVADEHQPEIAIIDIGLPFMNGYEVARELRQRLATPPQIVAVSGYVRSTALEDAEKAEFADHLVKPINLETLLAVIQSLLPTSDA
jgi:CheY-like chemotaxis protein